MTDTSTKTMVVDEMELKEPEDEAAVEAAECRSPGRRYFEKIRSQFI